MEIYFFILDYSIFSSFDLILIEVMQKFLYVSFIVFFSSALEGEIEERLDIDIYSNISYLKIEIK